MKLRFSLHVGFFFRIYSDLNIDTRMLVELVRFFSFWMGFVFQRVQLDNTIQTGENHINTKLQNMTEKKNKQEDLMVFLNIFLMCLIFFQLINLNVSEN